MKKLVSFLVSVLFVISFALPVMASAVTNDYGADQVEARNMFAEINNINDIKNSIDNEQVLSFFADYSPEVELDFNYLLPVFTPTNSNTASKYLDILEFSNSYVAPVSTVDGKLLGMVELQKYNAKWVVGVFYKSYDLQGAIEEISIPVNTKTVFIDNFFEHEFAVLDYSKGNEGLYYSLDNKSRRGLKDDELIRETSQAKQRYDKNSEGVGAPIKEEASHKWAFYTIPAVILILLSGFIVFSKTRGNA